jgi:hypothetical protein
MGCAVMSLTLPCHAVLCCVLQGLCMPRLVYLVAQSEGRHFSLSAVDRRMGELYL